MTLKVDYARLWCRAGVGACNALPVASPGARLALPDVNFGFMPGAEGTQRLPRLIGLEKAARMMLTEAAVTGHEACELGLVDEVVQGDVVDGARKFARCLIEQGTPTRRTRDLPVKVDSVHVQELFAGLRADFQRAFPEDNGRQFIIGQRQISRPKRVCELYEGDI
ncbi:enoyl-CoA hydratase/isomerase family protein [Cupriavidus lacunae]|nr:enoyl-CoA hydratase/isomerase family protein [Cupriavidus lacunae]